MPGSSSHWVSVVEPIIQPASGSCSSDMDAPTIVIMDALTIVASEPMKAVLRRVQRASKLPAAVLVMGETGTGKEHVGRAIHFYSQRNVGPWVDVNCAAIPEHLIESELFGYEKGAFSGANSVKPGLVELADRGTIFLDEIGELDAKLQAKLLRVLDRTPFYRLGGVRKVSVDVRVVAATNQPLELLVEQGRFRRDLYHRLSQVIIHVPPLRERRDDIAPLARLFLRQLDPDAFLTEKAIAALRNHTWLGNARELRNAVTAGLLAAEGAAIDIEHITLSPCANVPPSDPAASAAEGQDFVQPANLADREREIILDMLERMGGNQGRAAQVLGISPRTLYRKLKVYRAGESNAPQSLTTVG